MYHLLRSKYSDYTAKQEILNPIGRDILEYLRIKWPEGLQINQSKTITLAKVEMKSGKRLTKRLPFLFRQPKVGEKAKLQRQSDNQSPRPPCQNGSKVRNEKRLPDFLDSPLMQEQLKLCYNVKNLTKRD